MVLFVPVLQQLAHYRMQVLVVLAKYLLLMGPVRYLLGKLLVQVVELVTILLSIVILVKITLWSLMEHHMLLRAQQLQQIMME